MRREIQPKPANESGKELKQMKIGNLQTMPWYLRLVMFVAVAAVLYAGFWYFITQPTARGNADSSMRDCSTPAEERAGANCVAASE